MRQTGAKIRRKQRADALLASATHIAQVAAEERAAGRLEVLLAQPESAKDLKAAEEQQLAGSAGRNSYRTLHRPLAAYRISNKTCFLPRVLLRTFSVDWRMLLNPKPAGQHANAAGISKSAHVHRDSGATNENTLKHLQKLHRPSAVA